VPASVYSLGTATIHIRTVERGLTRTLRSASLARIAALLFALLVIGSWIPARAAAHSELISSDPAANATLAEAPDTLTMTFSEAIDARSATVNLLTTRQQVVPRVGPVSVDRDGTTATTPLPTLTPGTYTVSYQVTSAVDGHVTTGIFAFLIDPTGTQPPPTGQSTSTSLSSGLDVIAARWLALAATLALVGVVIFWLFSARPALAATGTPEVAAPWGPIAVAAVASLLGLVLYLTLAARPIVASGHLAHDTSFPLDFAAPFGWTPFAIAMRVAMVGAFACFVLAASHWVAHDEARRGSKPAPLTADRRWLAVMLAAGIVTLAGMSFAGHAAALGGPLLGIVDLVHLVAVAAWIGTLAGLFLLVIKARPAVGQALRRHSRLALAAAPVVVLSGLANSPLVLGSSRELVASGYGNLLLAKALLFSAAVAIGSVNFFLVRSGRFRRALPLIGAELAIGTVAVLAAAGLVSGQPSADRQPVLVAQSIATAHLYGEAGASSVHAAVNLPAPGNQRYQVGVADLASGRPRTDVQRVFLVFAPPHGSDLAPERVSLNEGADPAVWGVQGAYTPVVGDWGLDVIVRRVGERDESVHFDLPVTEPQPAQTVPPPDIGVGVPAPLAAAWRWLPAGTGGWLLLLGLLALALGLAVLARARPSTALSAVRAALVLAIVAFGLAIGSRAVVEAANQPPQSTAQAHAHHPSAESVARGKSLYLANCAACHGGLGDGDGPTAQRGGLVLQRLTDRVPALSDGALAYRIAVGTVGSGMPGFASTLSEDDRWDLVSYLRETFGAQP
jgi:methionine-rich copper-binding protein CopC/putative copper export protein/mono/diheme cytochrome c family protein